MLSRTHDMEHAALDHVAAPKGGVPVWTVGLHQLNKGLGFRV